MKQQGLSKSIKRQNIKQKHKIGEIEHKDYYDD